MIILAILACATPDSGIVWLPNDDVDCPPTPPAHAVTFAAASEDGQNYHIFASARVSFEGGEWEEPQCTITPGEGTCIRWEYGDAAGNYAVEVSAPGYVTQSWEANVPTGETRAFDGRTYGFRLVRTTE